MLLGQAHALDHRLKQIAAEILEIPSLFRNRGKRSEILKTPSLKRNRDKNILRPGHTPTIPLAAAQGRGWLRACCAASAGSAGAADRTAFRTTASWRP